MNHIIPMLKPLNSGEYNNWLINHSEDRDRYETFTQSAIEQGIDREKVDAYWQNNFGVIPKRKPEKLYHCLIVVSKIKMIVTVLKRENPGYNEREYEVVKLNKIFLDTYNYERVMEKDEYGNIIFKLISGEPDVDYNSIAAEYENGRGIERIYFSYEGDDENVYRDLYHILVDAAPDMIYPELKKSNLSFDEDNSWQVLTTSPITIQYEEAIFNQPKEGFVTDDSMYFECVVKEMIPSLRDYALNYEDSGWFGLLSINKLLRKLNIKVAPYQFSTGWIKPDPTPKAFIQNMDFIEIVDFEIEDKEFEQNLYTLINERFKKYLKK